MPLHPKVEKLLAGMARLGLKPIDETPLPEARRQMVEASGLLSPPEPVHSSNDLTIPAPEGEIPLRIYRPSEGSLPVVVYFHGGGWVIGSIDSHDGYCRSLANAANCVVVSVEYRLAPEHKYPAATNDAYAAVEWISQNAETIGGRAGPIGIAGDSAGGNLAAVVALMSRDRGGPAIGCQVLIYPITDCHLETPSYLQFAEDYFLTRRAMIWFWDQYCPNPSERNQPYASPLRAETLNNLPPALILTAQYDPLRDEGEAYAASLREASVPCRLIRYDGMIHGFTRRFQLLDAAQEALTATVNWIQSHLL
jgi:acetyl esterase